MDDLTLYEEIIRLKKERQPAALAMVVESEGSSPRKAGAKMLVTLDGCLLGTVGGGKIEADSITAALEVIANGQPRTLPFSLTEEHGLVCGGRLLVYIEPILQAPQLVTVGAGHIGQTLTKAAREAGFQVTLVDPHPEGSDYRNHGFIPADLVCPAQEVFTQLPIDRNSFILIATRNHHDDFLVTRNALATEAGYIGLLGSQRKKTALRENLEQVGLPPEAFARVICPVGLDLGAETPEEIAVSIVAQLIQRRRNHAASGRSDSPGCGMLATDGPAQVAAAPR